MSGETRTVSSERQSRSYRLRKACLEVSDAEEFHAGLVCGQATLTNKQGKVSDEDLFEIFEETFDDLERSKTYLVGCVIGLVDALLHARKILPPEYAALLQPLKASRALEGAKA